MLKKLRRAPFADWAPARNGVAGGVKAMARTSAATTESRRKDTVRSCRHAFACHRARWLTTGGDDTVERRGTPCAGAAALREAMIPHANRARPRRRSAAGNGHGPW